MDLESLDPWALCPGPDREADLIRARKGVEVFGLPFECVWIPGRASREGVPSMERPPFRPNRGLRIREGEALFEDERVSLTPNRFPFFAKQCVVWPRRGRGREPDPSLLSAAFGLAERTGGSALFNSVGASASIPLAHGHLVGGRSPVLPGIPMCELRTGRGFRVTVTDPDAPFPLLVVGLQAGDADLRAELASRLLELRLVPSFNLCAQDAGVWIFPRKAETVPEASPYALGSAELWGRFVFPERRVFEAMDGQRLEAALEGACLGKNRAAGRALEEALETLSD